MIAKKLASATALWGPTPIAKVHYFFFGFSLCSGLKAIFFRASGAKQSFSSWWKHLNLQVILLKQAQEPLQKFSPRLRRNKVFENS